ncbi:Fur family transcriptional regulator [Saccharopolyspora gloriosae]|uniref:Fur family ferric uptake transcriptional regulator n=1 Tax=Saccharopolyspora gloriosae TaxID=455344 RepID=A0A840NB38_9PSEU|nr:Fur family transcriptional regulator [Saccharopolyspora gloriosae]MBB5067563.1 Fur family ferric uptake transcriptional regulator [Saccharopolyspora gloriosae]
MSAIDATALLREAELRVTRPRVAVLAMVADNPHSDTDTIATAVRRDLGSVSTQAVYDVLRALTEAGLVRRIEPAGSPARFETRVGDHHHHLVCRACGAVTDVSSAVGEAACLDVQDSWGFDLDEAEVTFWGRCPACLARDE